MIINACNSAPSDGAEPRLCVSDRTCDGTVDLVDFFEFFACCDLDLRCGDLDGSPVVDLGDAFAFFNGVDAGC